MQTMQLPQNLEAEQMLLGCVCISRDAWLKVGTDIKKEYFYLDTHKAIYEAVCTLHGGGFPIDYLMILESVKQMNLLPGRGDEEIMEIIVRIMDCSPSGDLAEYYAGMVKEKWIGRTLVENFTNYRHLLMNGGDPKDILSKSHFFTSQMVNMKSDALYVHISEPLRTAYEAIENRYENAGDGITGIPSGIPSLDSMTLGWQDGDYIIIAARPSNGKTALMLQIAAQSAMKEYPVGILSLEMTKNSLASRFLSHISHVSSMSLRSGKLQDDDWEQITNSFSRIEQWPLYVSDRSMHINDIPVIARRLVADHGIKILMLDYIGLIESDRMGTREQEVSNISKTCNRIAKDLNIPFIVLCQLNRASEMGKEPEPVLTNLRESGSLEADADVVLLIHNPRDKQNPHNSLPRKAKLILAKQRNLMTGYVPAMWDGNKMSFYEETTRYETENEKPPWYAE